VSVASGPSAVQGTAIAVTTSEAAIAAMPPGNWQGSAGALITVSLNYSPTATATALVLRVRQGTGILGTLVGVARTVTVANPNSYEVAFDLLDSSPFGLAQNGGVYTLTAQGTTAGGTVNIGTLSLETTAPIQ
jgi:hypothetical protein